MPKISVILTSYNRDWLLRQAIESVLSQVSSPERTFELFIMDDDSDNPETLKVLAEYGGTVPGWSESMSKSGITIKTYRNALNGVERLSRCGYGENINRALERAQGEYITYLTCDDIYLPGRLDRLSAALDAHPDWFAVFGIQRMVSLQDRPMSAHSADATPSTHFLGLRNPGAVIPNGACLVDHNSVMHRSFQDGTTFQGRSLPVGPLWPTDRHVLGNGDAVVWQKFADHGLPLYRVDGEPTDEHRYHSGSIQARGL